MSEGQPSRRARLALLGGYAVATFASFPHVVAGRVVDLGVAVAWLGPGLLVLGLAGLDSRRALRHGFLAGLAAYSAILHWIYVVTVEYGHAPVVVGILAPVGLAVYIALFTGAFGLAWSWLERHSLASAWSAALVWTALDHLRTFALTGFPWALLGYAQHENAALVGLASVTGVYGLSFATVLGSAAAAELLRSRRGRRSWLPAATALVGVAALHGIGLASIPDPPPEGGPVVRAAALQGNIDQGVKWNPEWVERTLSIYEDLSRRAAGAGASVILWPESAVPGAIEIDAGLRSRLSDLARETGAWLLVGGVGVELDERQERIAHFYDSAFVISPEGRFVDRYDKTHLVPFGEYVPFRALLGRLFGAVARGIASSDVAEGERPRALDLRLIPAGERADGLPRDVRLGLPICYELLFPDLVRRFVGDGGAALFAITNDAWYGRTGAPYQFLAITALRSAESGVWTLRAANTGVSAVIDGRGRVREETRIFERDWIAADIPLADPERATFYTRHGDVFAWACWIGWLAIAVYARFRTREGPVDE